MVNPFLSLSEPLSPEKQQFYADFAGNPASATSVPVELSQI